jgi:hypothetical protein
MMQVGRRADAQRLNPNSAKTPCSQLHVGLDVHNRSQTRQRHHCVDCLPGLGTVMLRGSIYGDDVNRLRIGCAISVIPSLTDFLNAHPEFGIADRHFEPKARLLMMRGP